MEDVIKRIGKAVVTIPVIEGTNLHSLYYPQYGLKLLANDKILAIALTGDSAPEIKLQSLSYTNADKMLSIGMNNNDLDSALKNIKYDYRTITDPNAAYRYYHEIGLGILIDKSKVKEFVIAQIPKRKINK